MYTSPKKANICIWINVPNIVPVSFQLLFAFQFFSINVFKEKFVNLFACFSSFKACSWLVNSLTTSM